ncbi:MIP/aquaporin family protein [Mycolicibacterium rhodesiae]|uniref:Aquaporin n=1 Tax=Mycolicibacterium rhodesiae TaxID=36814 RepID=A0A1X0J3P6_MYCRH|nr:MIP/aquaporin family protein [Mycolicibacterium rhodesiae]MCV7348077.1 aquaporin family protein [Mycolicibacterium rhodesiae]ORB56083.1 aquaporin [Mycolicibacterium rhodesiae]
MKTKHPFLGELSGEMLGTAILVLFGCGVVAQVVAGGFPKSVGAGDHNSIAFGWGLGVTMAVFVAGRISGAHLNPAVTVALTVFRGFERRKVLPFIGAQTAGAFLGALIVRFVYADQIAAVDPGHTRATQGIFSTSPGEGVSITTAFADQVVGTALLVMVIFALTSAINNPPMANMGPVIIGLLVVAIGMAWGTNAGYAINPARDFGPRLASWISGYQDAMYSANGPELYFWLPIVAPIIGGLLGGALFVYGIERFLPPDDARPDEIGVSEATAVPHR